MPLELFVNAIETHYNVKNLKLSITPDFRPVDFQMSYFAIKSLILKPCKIDPLQTLTLPPKAPIPPPMLP